LIIFVNCYAISAIDEKAEIERRRNMTDEEIMRENAMDPTKKKEKRQMGFMQKYYHKGAFFQDEMKEIDKTHDWAGRTGEDSYIDKAALPKVLQVKNFGRAGRTKYTHLADQDTSRGKDNMFLADRDVRQVMEKKMGGMKKDAGFDRPTKKRKV
jgi:microfibrillar-associated protein 1